jgi:hypothetical protein
MFAVSCEMKKEEDNWQKGLKSKNVGQGFLQEPMVLSEPKVSLA